MQRGSLVVSVWGELTAPSYNRYTQHSHPSG